MGEYQMKRYVGQYWLNENELNSAYFSPLSNFPLLRLGIVDQEGVLVASQERRSKIIPSLD